jgi:hypothetical protein
MAWNDTIPHTLGASNYAIMLRHMLIHERNDELHLLTAIPDWWLFEGNEIRVERAPTHFGLMNLKVTSTKKGIQVELNPPRRQPPKRTFLYLPKSRQMIQSLKGIEVVFRPNQKKHWDFSAVVKLYRQHAVPIIEKNHRLFMKRPSPNQGRWLRVSQTDPDSRGSGVECWSGPVTLGRYGWAER